MILVRYYELQHSVSSNRQEWEPRTARFESLPAAIAFAAGKENPNYTTLIWFHELEIDYRAFAAHLAKILPHRNT